MTFPQFPHRIPARGAAAEAAKAARLEAFRSVYAETGGDAVAAQRLGLTINVAEHLVRQLRREGRNDRP